MCARIFVVDDDSFEDVKKNNIISARVPKLSKKDRKQEKMPWVKTVHDIMADMLQIRVGDYIFLWKIKKKGEKNSIYGVYRAISKPFFKKDSEDDNAPYRIYVEKAYDFENSITEYELINCPYLHTPLWNIIGKKISNKARASSPLSPEEENSLIMLLAGKNPGYSFVPFDESRIINVENELLIDYSNTGTNEESYEGVLNIDPSDVHPLDPNHHLFFEKTMEAVFNQEFANHNAAFFHQLGIDESKVLWYSNYLPYSIEKSEMDYLIIGSDDSRSTSKIYLIDFMLGLVDRNHASRCIMYTEWVSNTLTAGADIIQPILIAESYYKRTKTGRITKMENDFDEFVKEKELGLEHPLQIFTCSFNDSGCYLKRVR